MANLTIPKMEIRMRPGAWSVGGFLGPNESLADVLRYDAVTLTRSGLTHRQVADALGRVIETGISRQNKTIEVSRGSRTTDTVRAAQPKADMEPADGPRGRP